MVERLSAADLDQLSLLATDDLAESDWTQQQLDAWLAERTRAELPGLIAYARWLYARRGLLVRRFLLLAACERISPAELATALEEAGWTDDDRDELRDVMAAPKGCWPWTEARP